MGVASSRMTPPPNTGYMGSVNHLMRPFYGFHTQISKDSGMMIQTELVAIIIKVISFGRLLFDQTLLELFPRSTEDALTHVRLFFSFNQDIYL